MNKGEFLKGLRERLSGEIPEYEIQEHIRYYENYLSEEIRSGKTEEEAVETLGNPYLIAKTILDMEDQEETQNEGENINREGQSFFYYENEQPQQKTYRHREIKINRWYGKLILLGAILLILILIFAVVGSLMAIVIRFLFPILVIGLAVYLFKKGKSSP